MMFILKYQYKIFEDGGKRRVLCDGFDGLAGWRAAVYEFFSWAAFRFSFLWEEH